MKPFRFSLTFAILSSLVFLLVLTWLLLSLISFKTAENDLLAQKNDEGRLLVASVVSILPEDLSELSRNEALSRLTLRISREPAFAGFLIIGADGSPRYALPAPASVDRKLLETVKNGREGHEFGPDGRILHRYSPVIVNGSVAGAARLSLSLASEQARLKKSRHIFLAYFFLDFLLLLIFGYFILNRIIVSPVRKLLDATERVTAGDYASMVQPPGCAEIAELADAFNAMVAALKAKRHELDLHLISLERANRELSDAREESIRSEKMASVGLLAAGMAHEVGTPLSAIIGFAGILRDELKEDGEKADYLRRIENEAGRIDRIVRSLLDYARPSQVELEPVRAEEVVNATVDLLQAQGALKGLQTDVVVDQDLPPVVADRHELQQVLINLLLNARDAMPGGGIIAVRVCCADGAGLTARLGGAAQMRIMGRRREDFHGAFLSSYADDRPPSRTVAICVSDTGTGIDEAHLGRIFDPFFTTKEPGHGTGLGLAISARIIDSFGGRIIAESRQGDGATLVILLPAAVGSSEGGGGTR